MRYITGLLLFCILLVLLGCAPQNRIILVPDPDGHVGKAEVATRAGTEVLDKEDAMTTVSSPSAKPTQVVKADPAFISKTFSEVLAVEPKPLVKFILYFEKGTTNLLPESVAQIDKILDVIKERNALNIAVEGNTDSSGSAALNDKLAADRADMVRDLLVSKGVNTDLISVYSYGQGNPLVPTPDNVSEPRNRRVEVIIH
ncbi:MAG: OmpA family protein [Desulfuromonadales bacterium]|nr:OmpA family protein [Desulfuromonadales bacterium]